MICELTAREYGANDGNQHHDLDTDEEGEASEPSGAHLRKGRPVLLSEGRKAIVALMKPRRSK